MSACNNLKQYGIPYSLTSLHTETPDSPEFAKDLEWFAGALSRCERAEEPANRLDRRATDGVQHGAIQRETAGVAGHFGRDPRLFPKCWVASPA